MATSAEFHSIASRKSGDEFSAVAAARMTYDELADHNKLCFRNHLIGARAQGRRLFGEKREYEWPVEWYMVSHQPTDGPMTLADRHERVKGVVMGRGDEAHRAAMAAFFSMLATRMYRNADTTEKRIIGAKKAAETRALRAKYMSASQ